MGTCDTVSVSDIERLKLYSAIYTNISLLNNGKSRRPTKLTVETGNGYGFYYLGDHLLHAYSPTLVDPLSHMSTLRSMRAVTFVSVAPQSGTL